MDLSGYFFYFSNVICKNAPVTVFKEERWWRNSEIDVLWQNVPPTPFYKISLKLWLLCPKLTCLPRKYLGLQKAMSILRLTTPRLLTERGYQQSNPSLEPQVARVSRLGNQIPSSENRSQDQGQSRWTNHQHILLHLDTSSNTLPEEKSVNHLKGANKGYFKTLSPNSCLSWTLATVFTAAGT